jgi:hypothetical protein
MDCFQFQGSSPTPITTVRSGEEMIFSPEGHRTNRALNDVGIEFNAPRQ